MCRPERVRDVPCGSASSPTWERTPQSRTVVGLRADQSVLAGFVTRRLRHGACPLVARRQTWEAPRRDRAHRSTDVRSRSQVRRCQRRVTDSTAVFREAGAHPGARRHPAFCAGGRFTAPSGNELTVPLPAGATVPPVQSRARTCVARHHRALHAADQGSKKGILPADPLDGAPAT